MIWKSTEVVMNYTYLDQEYIRRPIRSAVFLASGLWPEEVISFKIVFMYVR